MLQLRFSNQQAEKLKHDEKETKKLQDNLQSMQLKLSAREHICRNLQEMVFKFLISPKTPDNIWFLVDSIGF